MSLTEFVHERFREATLTRPQLRALALDGLPVGLDVEVERHTEGLAQRREGPLESKRARLGAVGVVHERFVPRGITYATLTVGGVGVEGVGTAPHVHGERDATLRDER